MSGPGCSICGHPKRQDIDGALQSGSTCKAAAQRFDASLPSLYRHARSGHHLAATVAPGTAITPASDVRLPASVSATLRAVERLATEAQRHLKDARKAGDHKATNGAITAAAKALELVGKLRGELQGSATVNVSVSAVAQSAIDLRSEADALGAADTTDAALAWLSAQIEAGDREAMRIVLELVRMLPSAEVQALQPDALAPSTTNNPDPDGGNVSGQTQP